MMNIDSSREARSGTWQGDGPVEDPEEESEFVQSWEVMVFCYSCLSLFWSHQSSLFKCYGLVSAGVWDTEEKILSHIWAREAKRRAMPSVKPKYCQPELPAADSWARGAATSGIIIRESAVWLHGGKDREKE